MNLTKEDAIEIASQVESGGLKQLTKEDAIAVMKTVQDPDLKILTKEDAIAVMKTVQDPDLGLDVWRLGFIQTINVENNNVTFGMTLSCPGCPTAPAIVEELRSELVKKGFEKVNITVIEPEEVSDEARILADLR